ncbi:hypothetical protein MIND_00554900 [Mycena indigotica]|uniref:Transmembrane protein n=1 Tax=Mycena indigotica TaxID=2126181 RepID=A0A8H6WCP9_9AGAR|nr:uncharacterized protein MIND_00554900 [Mycena indigotica]KAF7307599.1 hypothetical protein MIND_00554900 [Mycena indigotica]
MDAPTTFAVLGNQPSVTLSTSTSLIVTNSPVPTVINGVSTTINVPITSALLALVPIGTSPSPSARHLPARLSATQVVLIVFTTVGFLLVLGLVVLVKLRRRRARTREEQLAAQENNIDPFVDTRRPPSNWVSFINNSEPPVATDLSRSSTMATRQTYISNEMHRAREKMAELEQDLRLSQASANNVQVVTSGSTIIANSEQEPVIEQGLAAAMQQIEQLKTRIRQLESQRRSSWATGRSDVPPPGYYEIV